MPIWFSAITAPAIKMFTVESTDKMPTWELRQTLNPRTTAQFDEEVTDFVGSATMCRPTLHATASLLNTCLDDETMRL